MNTLKTISVNKMQHQYIQNLQKANMTLKCKIKELSELVAADEKLIPSINLDPLLPINKKNRFEQRSEERFSEEDDQKILNEEYISMDEELELKELGTIEHMIDQKKKAKSFYDVKGSLAQNSRKTRSQSQKKLLSKCFDEKENDKAQKPAVTYKYVKKEPSQIIDPATNQREVKFLNEAPDSRKEKRGFYDEPKAAIWQSKKNFNKKEDFEQKVSPDDLKKESDHKGKQGKYNQRAAYPSYLDPRYHLEAYYHYYYQYAYYAYPPLVYPAYYRKVRKETKNAPKI